MPIIGNRRYQSRLNVYFIVLINGTRLVMEWFVVHPQLHSVMEFRLLVGDHSTLA